MDHMWKITFLLEEEAFDPDCSQCGDERGSDDLPRLQVHAVRVDLPPALLQVQQDHLLIHLQGTLDTETHACIAICSGCFEFQGAKLQYVAFIVHFCQTLQHTSVMFTVTQHIQQIKCRKSLCITANASVTNLFLMTVLIWGNDL